MSSAHYGDYSITENEFNVAKTKFNFSTNIILYHRKVKNYVLFKLFLIKYFRNTSFFRVKWSKRIKIICVFLECPHVTHWSALDLSKPIHSQSLIYYVRKCWGFFSLSLWKNSQIGCTELKGRNEAMWFCFVLLFSKPVIWHHFIWYFLFYDEFISSMCDKVAVPSLE